MSQVNNPFAVIVGSVDDTVAAAQTFANIAAAPAGEIGFVNANTNLAVTDLDGVEEFYVVVKRSDGNIQKSPLFQTAGIKKITKKAGVAGTDMVVEVNNSNVVADTEYGIRLEFRNSETYVVNGTNQFSRYFSFVTPDSELLSQAEIIEGLANAINADTKVPATATIVAGIDLVDADIDSGGLISSDYSDGDEISAADLAAIIDYQKTDDTDPTTLALRITTTAIEATTFFQINPNYLKPLQTEIIVSLVAGFDSDASTETITSLVYGEGDGYNVQQKEYKAFGYRGSVYRQLAVTGLPQAELAYEAVKGTLYTQYFLKGVNKELSGYQPSEAAMDTVIAVPNAATTAISELDAILATIRTVE